MNPDKILDIADRDLRGWHLAAAIAAVAVLDGYVTLVSAPMVKALSGGKAAFDFRFSYSVETARKILAGLGEDGRVAYALCHSGPDSALALIECAALLMIYARLTRPGAGFGVAMPPHWRVTLLAAPMVQAVFDLAENLAVIRMVSIGPDVAAWQVGLASVLTSAKWVSAAIAISIAAGLAALSFFNWKRRRRG